MTVLHTTRIGDRNLRAAAEIIDRSVGRSGNREVSASDLDRMGQLLTDHAAGGPALGTLRPVEIELLQENLPKLKAMLGQTTSAPHELEPFCRAMWVDAIADPEVQTCAIALTKALDGGNRELSLATFLLARDAVEGHVWPGHEAAIAEAKAKLGTALKDGSVTVDAIRSLDAFFLEGVGGLLSFGPVRVGARDFDDVYRLPTNGVTDEAIKKGGDVDWGTVYAPVIEDFEKRFTKLAYDRVYMVGPQGSLFVALNEKGKLNDVAEGYRVSMRNDQHKGNSGEVLRVVDVANSWNEAVWGPWKKSAVKVAEIVGDTFKTKMDKKLAEQANALVNVVDADAKADKRTDLKAVSVAVTAASAFGAAAVNLPALAWVFAGVGVAATAASVVSFLQKDHDKAPIFHAMGVTINRDEKHWY
jgi:hypothetical protein